MTQQPAPGYFVEIVEYPRDGQPEKVHRRIGPMGERMADKVESGANRNLNHDRFFTRVVSEEREPEPAK